MACTQVDIGEEQASSGYQSSPSPKVCREPLTFISARCWTSSEACWEIISREGIHVSLAIMLARPHALFALLQNVVKFIHFATKRKFLFSSKLFHITRLGVHSVHVEMLSPPCQTLVEWNLFYLKTQQKSCFPK